MESLITSLNRSMDIERMNYRTFSQSSVFMIAGLKHLQRKYKNVVFVFNYLVYSTSKNLYMYLKSYIETFSSIKEKYMVIPLNIEGPTFGHANVLFFFKKGKQIHCERYDPEYSCCIAEEYHRGIDNALYKDFLRLNVNYISPESMSLIVCPQAYIKDNFGYCQTYTLMYIDKLLSNPLKDRLKVIADFPKEDEIERYIKDIVEMLLTNTRLTEYDKNALLNYDTIDSLKKDYISIFLFSIIS